MNGTRGHDCQININDCKSDEQCGYGTCVDIINGIKCTCDKGQLSIGLYIYIYIYIYTYI